MTMQSVLSVRAIAEVASIESEGYGAAVMSEEEMMLRKADSYFATDSRPIVLFDGTSEFFPPKSRN